VYHLIVNAGMAVLFIVSSIWITAKVDKKEKFSKLDILCFVAFYSVVLIYFFSKTKLYWYIYPFFIPLGIFGAKALCDFLRKDNLKKFAKICVVSSVVVIFLSCVISFVYPCVLKKSDNLQNFIEEMQIDENADIYVYDNGDDTWSQAHLLCVELYADGKAWDGGVKAFNNNKSSYLIIDRKSFEQQVVKNVEIDYENEHYILCSFEG